MLDKNSSFQGKSFCKIEITLITIQNPVRSEMQNQKVSLYLESLPDEMGVLGIQLREILFDLVPGIEERFSFNLPFYHYFGMFCYLNPTDGGIFLNFCRGKDLLLVFPELQAGSRKMVAGILLTQPAQLQSIEVRSLILGAAEWQQQAWKEKRAFVAGKSVISKAKKRK
jgi:hypothetical protein